jgi:hypothetical protein
LIADTRNEVRVPFTTPAVPLATTHDVMVVQVNPVIAPVTNGVVDVVVPRRLYVPPLEQFELQSSTR